VTNLVDDAWIPAQYINGRPSRISLRTALLEAQEIRGLALEAPTLLPAVLRQTLLPLLLGALGAPRSTHEWAQRHAPGELSKDQRTKVEDHLDAHREHFELFDTERPFAQVGGLEAQSGETKPVSLLIPSVATGNNVPMFTPFTEAYPFTLSGEDAALWLLHAHCWDTAAIKTGAKDDPAAKKGKTTGNPTGPLGQFGVIVPEGRTLYETLMLNTPIIPDGLSADDLPQWQRGEASGPTWESRPAGGLLDALTWQSRRIRLIPQESEDGERVRRVVVCAGDRLSLVRAEFEWHTAWTHTSKPKKGQLALRPRRHRPNEHVWQGLGTLLAVNRDSEEDGPRASELLRQIGELEADGYVPDDLPLQVRTCGVVYGNQSAIVEDVLADSLPLPTAALVADSKTRAEVLEAAEQADYVARALNRLSADLRRAEGAEPLPWDKGQRPDIAFLGGLDVPMRRLLAGLRHAGSDQEHVERGMEAWEQVVMALATEAAHQLLAAASPVTFLGREVDGRTFRAALAKRSFFGAVRKKLTRAANTTPDDDADTDGQSDDER
jgi:CRISPR system Cascade subunit CasA